MQDRRDAGKEVCRTGVMQDRRYAVKEGFKKRVMHGRRDAGKAVYRTGNIQVRHAPPFFSTVYTSGVVALKMVQVPSTAKGTVGRK